MAARILGRIGGTGMRLGKALVTTPAGLTTLGGLGCGHLVMQSYFGTATDFFEYTFETKQPPEKIVDFYSTEEFLQILGVFGFATNFVLAGVVWATDTDQKNTVWNAIEISFDITEREVVDPVTGKNVVGFFNKRERFKNFVPWTNILMWDQIQNYGFRRKKDGTIQIIHQGESFYGPWPVRLLVQLHARYVIWATEKHLNSELFGSEDLEAVEHQRENIPVFALKQFISSLKEEQKDAIKMNRLKRMNTAIPDEMAKLDAEKAKLEGTLAKLETLERRATQRGGLPQVVADTKTRGKGRLQRQSTVLHVDDPAAKDAISSAMADVGQREGGKQALAGLLKKHATNSA